MSDADLMGAALEQAALGLDAGLAVRPAAVTAGIRRDESVGLVRAFLEQEPDSRFAPWAQTLV
jgi:hypothetical protein